MSNDLKLNIQERNKVIVIINTQCFIYIKHSDMVCVDDIRVLPIAHTFNAKVE